MVKWYVDGITLPRYDSVSSRMIAYSQDFPRGFEDERVGGVTVIEPMLFAHGYLMFDNTLKL